MKNNITHNTNIASISPLPSASDLKHEFPLTDKAWDTVNLGRTVIPKILRAEDKRLLVIVGPCSAHNIDDISAYARKLQLLAEELKDKLFFVMRLVCGKPRSRATSQGRTAWQGLMNDPKLDESHDIELGFKLARRMMLDVTSLGIPIATEMLDPVEYQVTDDLLSLVWLGARDSNSQDKKKVASGVSTAVGFKHSTSGGVDTAVYAIEFATHHHVFPAPDDNGRMCKFRTKGNEHGFLIHRGFDDKTNYDGESINESSRKLRELGLIHRIVVDASHGNSRKRHVNQREVIMNVVNQIRKGNLNIAGVMYESFEEDGNQPIPTDLRTLRPGCSITDECDGWERTETTLRMLATEYVKVKWPKIK